MLLFILPIFEEKEGDFRYIFTCFIMFYSDQFWIGLRRVDSTSFQWLSGSYLTDFPNWRSGEPDNAGGSEDCVVMSENGELNDVNCTLPDAIPFICQSENGKIYDFIAHVLYNS